MKIAVCYFGFPGAENGPITNNLDFKFNNFDIRESIYHNNDEFLLSPLSADVYIHTWDIKNSHLIEEMYEPTKSIYEDQSDLEFYPYEYSFSALDQIRSRLSWKNRHKKPYQIREFIGNSSRWYSAKQSIKLALQSNSKYDAIISMRMDLMFNRTFAIPENLEENEILVSHWNDTKFVGTRAASLQNNHTYQKTGFMDLWFAGNEIVMSKFSELFDSRYNLPVNAHSASYKYAMSLGLSPRFQFYRGYDFELHRRQVLGSNR
ncbi:hypothetical protein N9J60_00645 [Alphaproteobacteria bacterium]|nr:hypothetical protein [Alphaproteobacteria bacterium]